MHGEQPGERASPVEAGWVSLLGARLGGEDGPGRDVVGLRPGALDELLPDTEALGHEAHEVEPRACQASQGLTVNELAVCDDGDIVGVREQIREAGEVVPVCHWVRRVPAVQPHCQRDPDRTVQAHTEDELLEVRAVLLREAVGWSRLLGRLVRAEQLDACVVEMGRKRLAIALSEVPEDDL